MRLALDQPITDLARIPLPLDETGSPVTLRFLIVESLLQNTDHGVSGTDRVQRFRMAMEVQAKTRDDFTVEEVVEFKKLIEQVFSKHPLATLYIGQAFPLLDNPAP